MSSGCEETTIDLTPASPSARTMSYAPGHPPPVRMTALRGALSRRMVLAFIEKEMFTIVYSQLVEENEFGSDKTETRHR